MAWVHFYHNTPDPLALACELIASAYADGRKVAVRVADPAMATQLDKLLWSFHPFAFVPHVDADAALANETPVVIGQTNAPPHLPTQTARHWPHTDLLFNLAADVPPEFSTFRGVVEIISQNEHDKTPARARWLHYKQHGVALKAFDSVQRERL